MSRRAVRRQQAILDVLAEWEALSATSISALLGWSPRAAYPYLAVLEQDGRVVGEWEDRGDDRPRRRLYRLATKDERQQHVRIGERVDREIAERMAALTPPRRFRLPGR